MLNNQEATTHAKSVDSDPSISGEDKVIELQNVLSTGELAILASRPYTHGDSLSGYYVFQPGFGAIMKFQLDFSTIPGETSYDEPPALSMHLTQIDLGDEALYGYGLGTDFLRKGSQVAYQKAEEMSIDGGKLTTFETDRTNLIKLNTIIKVFGEDNVTVWMRGDCYGHGSNRPLEQMLEDHPYPDNEDEWYLMQKVSVKIDPQILFEGDPPSN